jgi:hypothetical protein
MARRAPRFRWSAEKRLAYDLVRRGIGGKTVHELKRRMLASEFQEWAQYKALKIEEQRQATQARKVIIEW